MEKIILAIGLAALLGAGVYMINNETSAAAPALGALAPEVYTQYASWKLKYNKKYSEPDQDWYRLTVFKDNLETLKAHTEGPQQTYTLEANQFMDLTPQEFSETYLGTKPSKSSNGSVFVPTSDVANVEVDWRTKGVLNEVRNQGQCGSCWAFSAVGGLESAHAVAGKGLNAHSEQELVDCSTSYGNQGCNGGLMDLAFDYVIAHGITKRANYAYTARDGKCQRQAGDYHVSSYQDVPAGDCAALESAVQGRPVSVAVDANNWQFYSKGVFNNCGQQLDHGVVLVGLTADSYIVRNSWAAQWGEAGHIRLAKGNTCGICNAASFPVV